MSETVFPGRSIFPPDLAAHASPKIDELVEAISKDLEEAERRVNLDLHLGLGSAAISTDLPALTTGPLNLADAQPVYDSWLSRNDRDKARKRRNYSILTVIPS